MVEINACRSTLNEKARLECFDSIDPVVGDEGVSLRKPSEIPENLGGGNFDDSAVVSPSYRGIVKSCQKSQDGKWFFIFENDQIWKQVDRVKRRYKECNFSASITKDGFGYKLLIDEDPRPIRIKRHR